jgi:hypothetical protein
MIIWIILQFHTRNIVYYTDLSLTFESEMPFILSGRIQWNGVPVTHTHTHTHTHNLSLFSLSFPTEKYLKTCHNPFHYFFTPPFHDHNNSITLFHAGKFVQLISFITNSLTVSIKYIFISCQLQTQLFVNTLSLSCSVSKSSTEPRTCSLKHRTSDTVKQTYNITENK